MINISRYSLCNKLESEVDIKGFTNGLWMNIVKRLRLNIICKLIYHKAHN